MSITSLLDLTDNTDRTPVPFDGPPERAFWFLGEAPGAEEVANQRVFDGKAGKLFDSLLRAAGVFRGLVHVRNLVPWRPPNNDFGVFYHDKDKLEPTDELLKLRNNLLLDIVEYMPKVIVAMGAEAMKALLPFTSISNHRGSIYELNNGLTRVVPTFHPAHV